MAAARENASILIDVTDENIALGLEAAGWNAAQVEALGEYNAAAVERARDINAELMAIEALERMRQHILSEARTAGTIRAMNASSGLSANEGTPLYYLNDQMDEMLHSRKYTAMVDTKSVLGYIEQESTRADLIRLESSMQADAIRFNAAIEGEIARNDAEARAQQMINSGGQAMAAARIQAQGQLIQGVLGAVSAYARYGGDNQETPSATGYAFNPYPAYGQFRSYGGGLYS